MNIAITMGDPSGVGAEIIVRSLAAASPAERAECRIFGDAGLLARAATLVGAPHGLDGAEVVPVSRLSEADAPPGRPTAAGGAAQVAYLEAAVQAIQAGACAALCTAPISKRAVAAAGFGFPGHTEFLAARAGGVSVAMMLAGPRLRVVLATIHHGLAEVPRRLTADLVARAAILAGQAMTRDFGIARPRIAVAGLNPHAGEGGLFGDEEARLIAPGIASAQAALPAAEISGPHVPDAVFRAAMAGSPGFAGGGAVGPLNRFDAVVAMYHDQGLIPVKLIDFEEAVNVTLGLPYPRTSPDHGVAYDIAGQGVARATSFTAALALARRMAEQRRVHAA